MVPTHLGIIPDGNRRWAKSQGLPSIEGHRRGVRLAKEIAIASFDRGVRFFTMYGFSTENWRRTEEEVGYLMELFYGVVTREFQELEKRGVRFRVLGSREGLSKRLVEAIDDLESRTADYPNGTVSLCLNYGGQQELADAFRSMLAAGVTPDEVTPALIAEHIYAPEVPPVDLVIRMSGEQRISGFMLWRINYAELYFVNKHWPAFTVADLDDALAEFARRQRRYGN
jgi:undecaprenyl diphosphate synthase